MITKEKAIRHIRGPAAQAAAETVRHIRPCAVKDGILHIAEGTPIHSAVSKGANHLNLGGGAANIPVQPPETPGMTRFDATLRSAERTALRCILVALATLLDTHPDDPPHPLYHDPDVQEAARTAARDAMPDHPDWEAETPGQAGYRLLQDFVGHHTVVSTINIFGPHAALKHAALYTRNSHVLHQAADTHPNALIFLGARSYLSNRHLYDFKASHDVLKKAKETFVSDVRYRPRQRKGASPRNDEDTAELLWTIFLALPADIVRDAKLERLNANIVRLCEAMAETSSCHAAMSSPPSWTIPISSGPRPNHCSTPSSSTAPTPTTNTSTKRQPNNPPTCTRSS